ncbi:hypothetical protein KJ980_02995 [Patescibacteria group bacterium]|nr:hypothetical protein [Patescibacteria group bacterium]
MKVVTLTDEELELLEAIEKGEFVSVKNLDQAKKDAIDVAKNTLNKTKNINIRLSEKDLQKIKTKAVEDGLPYQTLVSSIIHRFINK